MDQLASKDEAMNVSRRQALKLIAGAVPAVSSARTLAAVLQDSNPVSAVNAVKRFVFDGVSSELRISVTELGQQSPADLSAYSHLVMETRTSLPQRLLLWAYTPHGPRSMSIIGTRTMGGIGPQ